MEKPVPQDELIEEDGAQDEALCRLFPFRWHLSMSFKEGFELLIPRLHRPGAQQMKDAANFPSRIIRLLFSPPSGTHQEAIRLIAETLQFLGPVMAIA
jgi:hypothetical protein